MNTGTQPHARSASSAPATTRALDWFVSNFVRDVPACHTRFWCRPTVC